MVPGYSGSGTRSGKDSRRRLIDRRRRLHAPALRADAPDCIPRESGPSAVAARAGWPPGGSAVSCFIVRCMRSCRPFCSGCPASMRSGTIPSLIHHTASRDSPATARDRKRRSVVGANRCRHSDTRERPLQRSPALCAVSVFSTAWQRSRYRLCASEMVSGSMRSPSPVRNQPLKSAHHTRLGPSACANGSLYGWCA